MSCAARFFNSASNWPGLYFLASALASLRAICCGRSGGGCGVAAATAGLGGGGGGAAWVPAPAAVAAAPPASAARRAASPERAAPALARAAPVRAVRAALRRPKAAAPVWAASARARAWAPAVRAAAAPAVASRSGMFGLGCVARVSGPIVTSWTAIGISAAAAGETRSAARRSTRSRAAGAGPPTRQGRAARRRRASARGARFPARGRMCGGDAHPRATGRYSQRLTAGAARAAGAGLAAAVAGTPLGVSAISDTLRKPAALIRLMTSSTRP